VYVSFKIIKIFSKILISIFFVSFDIYNYYVHGIVGYKDDESIVYKDFKMYEIDLFFKVQIIISENGFNSRFTILTF